MSNCVKEGYLQKWSKNKFNSVYLKLLSSGWLQWFESQSSTSPKRSVDIKLVHPFLAFDNVLYQVPCKPNSISNNEIPRSFGVPHEPHKGTKMTFFVCSDPIELQSWKNEIMKLLQIPTSTGGPPPYAAQPNFNLPAIPGLAPVGMSSYPPQPAAGYPTQSAFCSQYPPAAIPRQPAYVPPMSGQPSYPQQQLPNVSAYPTQAPYNAYNQPNNPYAPGMAGNQGQCMTDKHGKPYTIVYKNGKPKKKKWKNAAMGLAAGAAGGYLAGKVFGGGIGNPFGGFGGGMGMPFGGGWGGRHRGWGGGSWSSLSSWSSASWSD